MVTITRRASSFLVFVCIYVKRFLKLNRKEKEEEEDEDEDEREQQQTCQLTARLQHSPQAPTAPPINNLYLILIVAFQQKTIITNKVD